MKNRLFKGTLALGILVLAMPASSAVAQSYINISSSGNTLNISVSGTSYGQAMDLVYTLPGSSLETVVSNIGNAYSGSWNGTLNLNEYGIVNGSSVYVRVGGQQSNVITVGGYTSGCTYNCGTPYGLSLSQNNVYLNVGQSQTVTVNNYGSAIYISSNSNQSVVSASISGNQINLYGLTNGSSTVTVCASGYNYNYSYGYNSGCASIYVTISGSVAGSNTNLYFSPSSPTMYVGQELAVSINSSAYNSTYYYGSNAYYISTNANSNVVSANISGTVLNLRAYQAGSSTITVCHSSLNFCGTLYVSVGGGGYGGPPVGGLSLSQTSLNLNPYQNAVVTINGNGNYYIASNSNPNAASAAISGNSVSVYAYASGSTSVSVCQNYNSQCVALQIYVGGGNYGYNDVRILNTTLPAMVIGQYYSQQLNASGGVPPYTFSVNSGGLPTGLNLSNSGLLYGVPQYAIAVNFSVKVTDNQGRSASMPFTINGGPSTGSGSLSGGVLGASTYKNGQLIKEVGTIYIVYRNLKTGFANWSAFTGFGFRLSNVTDVGSSGLANSGYTISTSHASHPWGSWIKSGQTVYFVHESGLIPIPDWNTFLNNGGQATLIVGANFYDLQLPMLSPMASGDSRLN